MRNSFFLTVLLSLFVASNSFAQPAFEFPRGLNLNFEYSLNEIFDISPDGRKAAVIGNGESGPVGSSQVVIIDAFTGERTDTELVQNVGGAISVKFATLSDGVKVLVLSDNNNGNKFMTIFDYSPEGALTFQAHTQLNNNPGVSTQGSNIVYSPATRTAFAAVSSGTIRIYSVSLDSGVVLNSIPAAVSDNLNLFEDATRRLIVSGRSNSLLFIDYSNPSSMQVLGSATLPSSSAAFGTNQFSTAFTNDGNYVFAGNGYSLLSAINTTTRQVVGSVASSRYRVRQLKLFENASTRFLVMRGLEDGDNAIKGYAVINVEDPTNPTVVNELIFGEEIFRKRGLAISRNGRRVLIGSEGRLSAYSLPQFTPIWEVPLSATESIHLTTFGQPERVLGAWWNKVFSLPNFTNRTLNLDLDGKTEIGTFRPSSGTWQWMRSTNGVTASVSLGQEADLVVPADYDGDEKADIAVFRPASGEWRIIESSTGALRTLSIGSGADVPVPGDYDGDGKIDVAVFRKNPNRWVVLRSSDGTYVTRKERFGKLTPVTGDYDGDGKSDFAVFANGTWLVSQSTGAFMSLTLGSTGSVPLSADFDNDGKTDPAVFDPATQTWRIQQSYAGLRITQFGQILDIPVPADYDGDGKADLAIFRPSNSTWQVMQSTNNTVRNLQFGIAGDIPLTQQGR